VPRMMCWASDAKAGCAPQVVDTRYCPGARLVKVQMTKQARVFPLRVAGAVLNSHDRRQKKLV
jgi:hypothetical protein